MVSVIEIFCVGTNFATVCSQSAFRLTDMGAHGAYFSPHTFHYPSALPFHLLRLLHVSAQHAWAGSQVRTCCWLLICSSGVFCCPSSMAASKKRRRRELVVSLRNQAESRLILPFGSSAEGFSLLPWRAKCSLPVNHCCYLLRQQFAY